MSTKVPEYLGRRALLLHRNFNEALALCHLGILIVEHVAVSIRT